MIRRRRDKKRAALRGQLLLAFGMLAISALGYAIYILNQQQVKRDIITMCRTDGEVARETAIVIDATDNFSPSQALLIKKEIQKILEGASVDERFTFYVLGERIGDNRERFSVCNPAMEAIRVNSHRTSVDYVKNGKKVSIIKSSIQSKISLANMWQNDRQSWKC